MSRKRKVGHTSHSLPNGSAESASEDENGFEINVESLSISDGSEEEPGFESGSDFDGFDEYELASISTDEAHSDDQTSENKATLTRSTQSKSSKKGDGFDQDEDLGSDTNDLTFRSLSASKENNTVNAEVESGSESESQLGITSNYRISEDANGNPRYVYGEIDPTYDSDDSDAPATTNTIGDIPASFYDSFPHIGYDINGKKVMRPAKGEALDALLDSIEIPKGWTGLTDPATGKSMELSKDELELIRRIRQNEIPVDGYDPYPATVEYFTGRVEQMPLSAAPEPKRRFVPSKHEAKRVMKLVQAIRQGRILPYRPPTDEEDGDVAPKKYDIWADETPRQDHVMNIPAPKLPIPSFDQSYNPPPEYLPSKSEKAEWEEADPEDREKEYLPTKHDALRKVPGYEGFVKERFERCLDLYLAPRIRRSKLNIDPESLLPRLPHPDELRPFPRQAAIVFAGHAGKVRSLSVHSSGSWLASGGDDGTVRVWDSETGYEQYSVKLSKDDAVNAVQWRPSSDSFILAAAVGSKIYLLVPPLPQIDSVTTENASDRAVIDNGFGYAADSTNNRIKEAPATWDRPSKTLVESHVLLCVTLRSIVKVLSWHRRGDYLVSCSPAGQTSSIAMHTLSKHLTQLPFRRLKGLTQYVQFHPSKPVLFVATQQTIRSYDLQRQVLLKTLQPGARWISSFDIHPAGDNLIVGSYDRRLLWHDLDLDSRPYKTLRYHPKAIRAVKFHPGGYPLFADASDDGTIQILHGKVVNDAMENATIVPLKVLKGHRVSKDLGVLDIAWHPRLPWCYSAGADGNCILWN